jgi:hypothetical protein
VIALDRRCDLGHPLKLDLDFRLRTGSRQLYYEEPRAARSDPVGRRRASTIHGLREPGSWR